MTVRINIDGKPYETEPGRNLLEFCLSVGIDIPHFCYHPAMGSVGACRLCAVKKFFGPDDTRGMVIMSCLTYIKDGMRISTNDPEILEFRASVIENLMINHPHDCPVCDEGGECHLQDMTVMTGHNYRRYAYEKRTYRNQYLGPFIKHEMNRCIQCYRCVRFYKDFAGGRDFGVFGSADRVYFGRHQEGPLESEFSGNLIEVCPTGVFTDKTLSHHYTRKWDLTNAPSVCVHCSVGCNIIIGERYGSIRRVLNRYNSEVNGYFICDRGRFGYEWSNGAERIRQISINNSDEKLSNPDRDEVLSHIASCISEGTVTVGIGSPRASVESNFALLRLTGREHFYHGISAKEQSMIAAALSCMQKNDILNPSLKEIQNADAILIIEEDPVNTAPMAGLAVRRAAAMKSYAIASSFNIKSWHHSAIKIKSHNARFPVFIASSCGTKLDGTAAITYEAGAHDISRFLQALKAYLNNEPPPGACEPYVTDIAKHIASELQNAANPLILTGTQHGNPELLDSSLDLAMALKKKNAAAMLSLVMPECNSAGLAMMPGKPMDALDQIPEIDNLLILENDIFRRAHSDFLERLLQKSKNVIAIDCIQSSTAGHAHIVLPAASFAEARGTLVNTEGRAQRFYNALVGAEPITESWKWLDALQQLSGRGEAAEHFGRLTQLLVDELPAFAKLIDITPTAGAHRQACRVPRQTDRFSGRTANKAHIAVSETAPLADDDSPLAFSMEGRKENTDPSLIPFYWVPNWNSVQAFYKYIPEANGPLKYGDPGVKLRLIPGTEVTDLKPLSHPDPEKWKWYMVPVLSIFGSEELSALAPAIAERMQSPCVFMNSFDAESASFSEGDLLEISTPDTHINLPLRIDDTMAQGCAGILFASPGMPFMDFPFRAEMKKA